jgi:hypothetical protein
VIPYDEKIKLRYLKSSATIKGSILQMPDVLVDGWEKRKGATLRVMHRV